MGAPTGHGRDVPAAVAAMLVCPACRSDVVPVAGGLGCEACHLLYPVVDGVPWMLPDRARKWKGQCIAAGHPAAGDPG